MCFGLLVVTFAWRAIASEAVTPARVEGGSPDVVAIVREHDQVVPYYIDAVNHGLLPRDGSAVVIHVDSHPDMGVPLLFPDDWPDPPTAIDPYVQIMDFLLQSVHLGIVGHLVIVEPPWGMQFHCCFESKSTWDMVVGEIAGNLKVDVLAGGRGEHRTRFGHIFYRNGPLVGDHNTMARKKPFKLTFLSLSDLPHVHDLIDPSSPLIFDLDLDVFTTESPGAIVVREALNMSNDDLQAMYHLVWDKPSYDADYLKLQDAEVRATLDATTYRDAFSKPVETSGQSTSEVWEAMEPILSPKTTSANLPAVKAIIERAANSEGFKWRGMFSQFGGLEETVLSFLEQPFHFGTTHDIRYLVDFVGSTIATLPRTPTILHLVRSPGYVPPELLPLLECTALRMLTNIYTGLNSVKHDGRVTPFGSPHCDNLTAGYAHVNLGDFVDDEHDPQENGFEENVDADYSTDIVDGAYGEAQEL